MSKPRSLITPRPPHYPAPTIALEEERIRAEEETRVLGELIGRNLPEGYRFVLMLADGAPEGFFTYVSNGRREDVIALLREAIVKIGGDNA